VNIESQTQKQATPLCVPLWIHPLLKDLTHDFGALQLLSNYHLLLQLLSCHLVVDAGEKKKGIT
jgi:hypothetical protein